MYKDYLEMEYRVESFVLKDSNTFGLILNLLRFAVLDKIFFFFFATCPFIVLLAMSDYLFATTFISMDYAFTVGAYHSTIGDDSLLFAYDIVSAVFNLVIVHSFVLLLIGCVTQ